MPMRDHQRMRRGRFRRRAVARAQRARHRGGDAAAHRAGRHLAERHLRREHQRERGEIDQAELAHEPAVGDADQALHRHVQHVGRGQGQDGRHDRADEHHLPAFSGSHGRVSITRRPSATRAYLMPRSFAEPRRIPVRAHVRTASVFARSSIMSDAGRLAVRKSMSAYAAAAAGESQSSKSRRRGRPSPACVPCRDSCLRSAGTGRS